jgi:hypothetical protein
MAVWGRPTATMNLFKAERSESTSGFPRPVSKPPLLPLVEKASCNASAVKLRMRYDNRIFYWMD